MDTLLCGRSSTAFRSTNTVGSGYFRGSPFTACAIAQVAHGHGLRVPRGEPRPRTSKDERPRLPPSHPCHSFSAPASSISISEPSSITFREFLHRMLNTERFLIERSFNTFQLHGSQAAATWSDILPFQLTPRIVARVGLKPESVGFVARYNETAPQESTEVPQEGCSIPCAPQGGHSIPHISPSAKFDPILIRLADAMAKITYPGHSREAFDARQCRELLQHIADPERHQSPSEKTQYWT